jgi:hypothetical protein
MFIWHLLIILNKQNKFYVSGQDDQNDQSKEISWDIARFVLIDR